MYGGRASREARRGKLIAGVGLLLTHPELPSCENCKLWLYGKDWKIVERAGKPCKRPSGDRLPCHQCPKSSDGQPNPGAELSSKNSAAFQLYLEIKAGRPMPDDKIVQRNCALIRWAEDQVARGQMAAMNCVPIVQAMVARSGSGKGR